MGNHINDKGEFQSDRHPELAPDKIVLSFRDPEAAGSLLILAEHYRAKDPDLSRDIMARLCSLYGEDAGPLNDGGTHGVAR